MKHLKFLSIYLLMAMVVPFIVSCGGSDDEGETPSNVNPDTSLKYTDNGYFDGLLYYKVVSNETMEVTVVGSEETIATATIPTNVIIKGRYYKVTSINDNAFYKCNNLTSVNIPNSVTSIGDYVFYDCSKLISVSLPNTLTSIGDYAFAGCTSLTTLVVPESVTNIGEGALNFGNNEQPSYKEPEYQKFDTPQWKKSENAVGKEVYAADMTAYITLPDSLKANISNADELAAFCGDEIRGTATRPANDDVWCIRMFGNVGDALTLKYYCATNKYMYKSAEPLVLTDDTHIGTYDEPVTIYMKVIE